MGNAGVRKTVLNIKSIKTSRNGQFYPGDMGRRSGLAANQGVDRVKTMRIVTVLGHIYCLAINYG